ncbi:MAG: hypothetical protein OXC40_05285 [Proteobacteria bacterium]|nr:hypothetical protein [Pseudomonadota bacterium]
MMTLKYINPKIIPYYLYAVLLFGSLTISTRGYSNEWMMMEVRHKEIEWQMLEKAVTNPLYEFMDVQLIELININNQPSDIILPGIHMYTYRDRFDNLLDPYMPYDQFFYFVEEALSHSLRAREQEIATHSSEPILLIIFDVSKKIIKINPYITSNTNLEILGEMDNEDEIYDKFQTFMAAYFALVKQPNNHEHLSSFDKAKAEINALTDNAFSSISASHAQNAGLAPLPSVTFRSDYHNYYHGYEDNRHSHELR